MEKKKVKIKLSWNNIEINKNPTFLFSKPISSFFTVLLSSAVFNWVPICISIDNKYGDMKRQWFFFNFIFIILIKWDNDIDLRRKKGHLNSLFSLCSYSLFLLSLSFSLPSLSPSLSLSPAIFVTVAELICLFYLLWSWYTDAIPRISTLPWQPTSADFQLLPYTSWCLGALSETLSSSRVTLTSKGITLPAHQLHKEQELIC